MESQYQVSGLVRELAARQRVIVLGGRALVFHGHAQPVHDVDVWLDPGLAPEAWCDAAWSLTEGREGLGWVCPANWVPVSRECLPTCVAECGMVRLTGCDEILDIIRQPANPQAPAFDEVWLRAGPVGDGTRMPAAADLLRTIPETEREIYQLERAFLRMKIENEYRHSLCLADEATAMKMLDVFISDEVARAGMSHPCAAVSDFCHRYLLAQSDDGDPFATDILFEFH
jgi:hypothetical protein